MNNKLDFYASEQQYIDHIAPIWNALPVQYKGSFFIASNIEQYAKELNIDYIVSQPTNNLTLVASFADYEKTGGPVMYMEHGVGNTYGNESPYYAGGLCKERVVMFLNSNSITDIKNTLAYPRAHHVIVGTPKMDALIDTNTTNKKPVVCLSFHWDCDVVQETLSAFTYYESQLEKLNKNLEFELVLHGHPKENDKWNSVCKKYGIRRVQNLRDVFKEVDVYVCDNSSSMYEFMAIGKPVIVLNAPWYRKYINHGIRFWEYIPGPQVDGPLELEETILKMIKNPEWFEEDRKEIKNILYPYYGESALRAAHVIIDYLEVNNGHIIP